MALNVNKASIEISAVDKTRGAFDSVKRQMASGIKDSETYFKNFAIGAASSVAALLGVGSAVSIFKNQISSLSALDDLAQKTGSAVENLSRLQKVAINFNQDFGVVDQAITKLAKGIGQVDDESSKANKALGALGISSKDLEGNLRDPSELFIEIAKNLQGYKDDASKAALANDLFGKSGAELIPFMNDAAESIDSFTGASAASASQAAAFEDRLGGVKVAANNYFEKLAIDLLPVANDFLDVLINTTGSANDLGSNTSALNWADSLALGLARVLDVLKVIPNFVGAIISSFEVVFEDIKTLNEAAKLGNPFEIYSDVKSGKNVLGDFTRQLDERKKVLERANGNYDRLFNEPANKYEKGMLDKIAGRQFYKDNYESNVSKLMEIYKDAPLDVQRKAVLDATKAAGFGVSASPYVTGGDSRSALNYSADKDKNAAKAALDADKEEQRRIDLRREQEKYFEQETTKFYNLLAKTQADDEKAIYETKLKNIDLISKAQEDRLQEEQRLQEEILREEKRARDDINQSLTDAIFTNSNNGKDLIDNFKDTFKSTIDALILRPTISATIDATGINSLISYFSKSITSAVSGAFSNDGVGSSFLDGQLQNRQSGIGGIFSDVGNIFTKTNQSIIGGIEGIGANISNGLGGIRDTIGGFVGANASTIANLTSYAGAALQLAQGNFGGAVGTAIGTFFGGPLGGAIGSFLGGAVGGLFGGKQQPPRSAGMGSASVVNGVLSGNSSGIAGRNTYDPAIAGNLQNASMAFAGTLNNILDVFGKKATISAEAIYSGRAGGSGYGTFNANVGGKVTNIGIKDKDAFGEASFNKFLGDITGKYLLEAIQSLDIDSAFKGVFSRALDINEVNQSASAIKKLFSNAAQLNESYDLTAKKVANHANALNLSAAQFVKYTNAVTKAANSSMSVGEILIKQSEALSTIYKGAIPTTIEAFDAKMKSLANNPKGFANLLGIRDNFLAFTNTIDGITKGVEDSIFGLLTPQEQLAKRQADLDKLFNKYDIAVPGSLDELVNIGKNLLTAESLATEAGLDMALAFPSLVKQFEETTDAANALFNALRGEDLFSSFADFQAYNSVARNYGNATANAYIDGLMGANLDKANVLNNAGALITPPTPTTVTSITPPAAASTQAANAKDTAELLAEVKKLNANFVSMLYFSDKTFFNTKRTADILSNVTPNGDAIATEPAV